MGLIDRPAAAAESAYDHPERSIGLSPIVETVRAFSDLRGIARLGADTD